MVGSIFFPISDFSTWKKKGMQSIADESKYKSTKRLSNIFSHQRTKRRERRRRGGGSEGGRGEGEEEEEESEMKSPTLAAAVTFLLCSFVEIRRMKVVVFVSTTSLLVRSDECIKR